MYQCEMLFYVSEHNPGHMRQELHSAYEMAVAAPKGGTPKIGYSIQGTSATSKVMEEYPVAGTEPNTDNGEQRYRRRRLECYRFRSSSAPELTSPDQSHGIVSSRPPSLTRSMNTQPTSMTSRHLPASEHTHMAALYDPRSGRTSGSSSCLSMLSTLSASSNFLGVPE